MFYLRMLQCSHVPSQYCWLFPEHFSSFPANISTTLRKQYEILNSQQVIDNTSKTYLLYHLSEGFFYMPMGDKKSSIFYIAYHCTTATKRPDKKSKKGWRMIHKSKTEEISSVCMWSLIGSVDNSAKAARGLSLNVQAKNRRENCMTNQLKKEKKLLNC